MRALPLFAVLLLSVASLAQAGPRFPAVESSDLDRHRVSLPRDFAGERNLVLVAFERRQQKEVDTWLAEAKPLQQADPALEIYELPVIGPVSAMTRWFIDNGMRSGIPEHARRARTVTLYLEKKPFRAALALPDEKRIYALVVSREGSVLWRSEGPCTAEKLTSLRQALAHR